MSELVMDVCGRRAGFTWWQPQCVTETRHLYTNFRHFCDPFYPISTRKYEEMSEISVLLCGTASSHTKQC